jgi:hypothetical protein
MRPSSLLIAGAALLSLAQGICMPPKSQTQGTSRTNGAVTARQTSDANIQLYFAESHWIGPQVTLDRVMRRGSNVGISVSTTDNDRLLILSEDPRIHSYHLKNARLVVSCPAAVHRVVAVLSIQNGLFSVSMLDKECSVGSYGGAIDPFR